MLPTVRYTTSTFTTHIHWGPNEPPLGAKQPPRGPNEPPLGAKQPPRGPNDPPPPLMQQHTLWPDLLSLLVDDVDVCVGDVVEDLVVYGLLHVDTGPVLCPLPCQEREQGPHLGRLWGEHSKDASCLYSCQVNAYM